ncbi:rtc4-like domain-containing [Trichoderma cornu-damae]|uniref:Restriction of telomere capping protein 4 n=1 Tax=Trichoderma cornu-damae TaxID=654480 RepID=A0A9P8TUZ5_9HYPO|nr:rtc4-like domain-containing [Trichoderma cornu-damae]
MAAPRPESKARGGRPQLKVPDPVPVPEDIFAPPLASSDSEGDDMAASTAADLESSRQPQPLADSSDSDGPPRGAIPATSFTSHLTNGHGFTRQAKVKATFGKKKMPGSQERRKSRGETASANFRPPPEFDNDTPRKSSKFIVPDDNAFSSPIKNGLTLRPLCPWCGAMVDTKQLQDFSKGRRLNVRMQTKFCEAHKKKSAMATWESRSYPQVKWARLEKRFKNHQDRLLGIINGEEESYYRAALADKIELGQARSMKKEENLNPGYYGPRGFNMMCDYLVSEFGDMLKKKAIHDRVIAGRGSAAFIQSVLVAELGVQLIMEDMRVSSEEARGILEESKALGELVHAEV